MFKKGRGPFLLRVPANVACVKKGEGCPPPTPALRHGPGGGFVQRFVFTPFFGNVMLLASKKISLPHHLGPSTGLVNKGPDCGIY